MNEVREFFINQLKQNKAEMQRRGEVDNLEVQESCSKAGRAVRKGC
jgi:hypothetical protein